MYRFLLISIALIISWYYFSNKENFRSLPFEDYRKLFMCRNREGEPGCNNQVIKKLEHKQNRQRVKVGILIDSINSNVIAVYRQRDYSNHGTYRLLLYHPCVSWTSWLSMKCEGTWEIWKDLSHILPSSGDKFKIRNKEYIFQEKERFSKQVRIGTLFPKSNHDILLLYRSAGTNEYFVKRNDNYVSVNIDKKRDIYHKDQIILQGVKYEFQSDNKL